MSHGAPSLASAGQRRTAVCVHLPTNSFDREARFGGVLIVRASTSYGRTEEWRFAVHTREAAKPDPDES